jgi:hypothetical protein
MGVVWRAWDRKRGREVALKTLQGGDAATLSRFKQEFRALADVAHPNLVALYELGAEGETWFFTMELIHGVDFRAYVCGETGGPAAPDAGRLRAALRQLAAGVWALHAAGQLHRDIKPGNVLVTREGRVVLLDFGLAGELDVEGLHHSAEEQILGAVAYMAPEQAACQPLSPASDWYSVGVLLYEALTGRRPFLGPPLQVLQDKQQRDPPPPRALAPDVPEDLDALCVALLHRDPRARPSGAEILARLGGAPVGRTPLPAPRPEVLLLGRNRQLEALEQAFAGVQQRRTVTACIHGCSGLGKSALVQHFLHRLRKRDGVVVLAGRCYEREAVPFKVLDPLVDALSRHLGRLPVAEAQALLPRDVAALGRVFPVLLEVETIRNAPRPPAVPDEAAGALPHEPAVPDPQELRRRAFAALRELLARLGDRRLVVLAIDDLQWGDADSAALLAELLRPPDAPPLLLLGCYRTEDAATSPFLRAFLPLLRRADAVREHHDIVVEALRPEDAEALAVARLGVADPAREVHARAIAREAAGNPFLVLELAQYVLGGAVLAEGAEVTLDQVLGARVAALPAEARALVEVVAVAGQPLRQRNACQAAGLPGEEREAPALLRAARLLRRTGPNEQDLIETYHDRIRETLVAQLAPAALREHHRRLAQVLEGAADTDPEILAAHFAGAGDSEKAGACYARAAGRAAEALAFDRAAALYRRALELRPGSPADERGLRAQLGDVLASAGRGDEAAREYFAAAAGAGAAEALELRSRAAKQLLLSGDIDEGLRTLHEVLAAVDLRLTHKPGWALLALLLRRVQVRLRGLGFQERPVEQVAAGELTRIDVAWTAALSLSRINPVASADLQARHLLLALRAGEPYRVARALALEAMHAETVSRRRWRRSQRLLEAAAALSVRTDHPHTHGLVSLAAGFAAQAQGRWRAAQAAYERAEQIFRDSCRDVAWELHTAQSQCSIALLSLGELAELRRRLPAHIREAQERGSLHGWTNANGFLRPLMCLIDDDLEGARRELANYRAHLPRRGVLLQHVMGLLAEAQVKLYGGTGRQAWQRFRRREALLRRSLFLRFPLVRILVRELRARCALAAAAESAVPGPLLREAERDARRLERERVPWAVAHARLLRAAVATSRGDRPSAIRLAAEAVRGFDAADMALYAAAARRRQGELLGGRAGQDLAAAAEAWMDGQHVRNPRRMTGLVAPGFPPAGGPD